jgi:hypothetical protein
VKRNKRGVSEETITFVATPSANPATLRPEPATIPMRLPCPACNELHVDEGERLLKPHHTHACQRCGNVWRGEPIVECADPAIVLIEFTDGTLLLMAATYDSELDAAIVGRGDPDAHRILQGQTADDRSS